MLEEKHVKISTNDKTAFNEIILAAKKVGLKKIATKFHDAARSKNIELERYNKLLNEYMFWLFTKRFKWNGCYTNTGTTSQA